MKEGILPLWKEKGMTSFACVRKVRGILGIKKVGHAGTLDPEVDGVLPIAIGSATKVLEFMLEGDKTYAGEITIGFSTATEDATGQMVEKKDIKNPLDEMDVDKILQEFIGKIQQTPPMFSAVKIDGKRLYEYAFEGIEIERPTRQVEIYELKRTSDIYYNVEDKTATFKFDVSCSKGTYIRTLAVDIGKSLGYPAHMSKLTRIKSGKISAEQTVTIEELEQIVNDDKLNDILLPIDYGLDTFSQITLDDELWQKVKNGALLKIEDLKAESYPVLLKYLDQIVSLYDKHPSKPNMLKPRKMFKIEL